MVWQALLESAAGEHGARMTAMKNATDNANELAKDLTLAMNKARQAQITREISEIAAGAEALSARSEEHTSELQSRQYLACRLLLEKKAKISPSHAHGWR